MSNSDCTNRNKLTRRQALLLSATAGLGIALPGTARASDSTKTSAHQAPGNCSTPRSAVANTQSGKVRGFLDDDVFTFKGIPYGQDTGGENRWLPVKPPKAWDGEYPALIYGVTRMAKMKCDQKGAPVFAYYFTWQSPMLEDAGAWHTAELAFCFDNTKRCEQGTGNTPEAQKLAKKMATAWANFARTGNPSQSGLTWKPFNSDGCPTMVFDNVCRMVDDPEGEVRKILLS